MKLILWLTPLSTVTAFGLHLLVARAQRPRESRQAQAAWVSAANTLGWTLVGLTNVTGPAELLFLCITTSGFSTFYFLLWNCTETARRVKILVADFTGDGRALGVYTPELMVEERVNRMVAIGALRREGDRFRAVPGILLAAALFFAWWRKFFRCEVLEP